MIRGIAGGLRAATNPAQHIHILSGIAIILVHEQDLVQVALLQRDLAHAGDAGGTDEGWDGGAAAVERYDAALAYLRKWSRLT